MKKTIYRFSFILGVLIISIIIVLGFVFIGDKSKGPISEVLNKLESKVIDIESDYLLSQREPVRSKELEWFLPYKNNKDLLLRPDTILWGIYDNHYQKSFENIISLEDKLSFASPLIQIYIAWGDKPHEQFPLKYVKAINNLGSIPFITWEPWLNDFERSKYGLKEKSDPNVKGLIDINNGDYDFYINRWALALKEYGNTVFIRLGHEMNDPYRYPWGPQNNKPEDFINAWRHVVQRFRSMEVDNVIWVWSPHPAYKMYMEYYPGNEYVDWVGVGALNYGTVALWSKWWTFDEIFGNYYDELSAFNKPIIITEFGSLAVGGNRNDWYYEALNKLPQNYHMVKSVIFYNNDSDNTTLSKTLDWSLNSDSLSRASVLKAIYDW